MDGTGKNVDDIDRYILLAKTISVQGHPGSRSPNKHCIFDETRTALKTKCLQGHTRNPREDVAWENMRQKFDLNKLYFSGFKTRGSKNQQSNPKRLRPPRRSDTRPHRLPSRSFIAFKTGSNMSRKVPLSTLQGREKLRILCTLCAGCGNFSGCAAGKLETLLKKIRNIIRSSI